MTNTVLPATCQRSTSRWRCQVCRYKLYCCDSFSDNSIAAITFPLPKQHTTPLPHNTRAASKQVAVAVAVSAVDDVMNSTATRALFCIHLGQLVYKATHKATSLRILCAVPTSLDLRGILFSTGRTLEAMVLKTLLGSPPPPLKQNVPAKAIFPHTLVFDYLHAKLFCHSFLLFCRFSIQDFGASTPLFYPWMERLSTTGQILLAVLPTHKRERSTIHGVIIPAQSST